MSTQRMTGFAYFHLKTRNYFFETAYRKLTTTNLLATNEAAK